MFEPKPALAELARLLVDTHPIRVREVRSVHELSQSLVEAPPFSVVLLDAGIADEQLRQALALAQQLRPNSSEDRSGPSRPVGNVLLVDRANTLSPSDAMTVTELGVHLFTSWSTSIVETLSRCVVQSQRFLAQTNGC